jgi:hypothetical protein
MTPSCQLLTTLVGAVALGCAAAADAGGPAGASGAGNAGGPELAGSAGTASVGGHAGTGGSLNLVDPPAAGGEPPNDDCSDASKLVYVASEENDLYSFAPDKLKFTKLGRLTCPSQTVNSMAVDRSGTAWVNYDDGKIYKVDIATLGCTATSYVPAQGRFTKVLGMGFATDAPGSSSETLFVADNRGKGIGKVDLATMTLTPLGPYTGELSGSDAELTGTGDARLFGFFTTSPAHFAAIDKATGQTPMATLLPSVDASSGGYAFSFWGGDFWFYTANDTPTTSVTHYVSKDGTASVVLSDIGFVIVGAGVSTCAPTVPPVVK